MNVFSKTATNVGRILRNSWKNFSRNIWLSIATLFMMFIALAVIGGLIVFDASVDKFVAGLREKVDVSVYFQRDAEENRIESTKERLESRDDVKSVEYISRDDALAEFTEENEDNEVLLSSLEELDDNPLQASLNIRVYNPEVFPEIVASLENSQSAEAIDSINFQENREVIENINNISASVGRVGLGFTIVLAALVGFVMLNTIRLAIYTARDEIHIMKLVGGSNWFVRTPFVLTGGLYGLIAGSLVVATFFVGTNILNSQVSLIFADINFYGWLVNNALLFTAGVVGGGIALGMASSYLAVRRYLHV